MNFNGQGVVDSWIGMILKERHVAWRAVQIINTLRFGEMGFSWWNRGERDRERGCEEEPRGAGLEREALECTHTYLLFSERSWKQ